MPVCTVLVGLPGSGKTTWRQHHSGAAVIVSTDDLIEAFAAQFGITYSDAFRQVDLKAFERQALADFAEAIRNHRDIIVDRTNLSVKSRARFLAQLPAKYEKHALIFEVSATVLAERLDARADATGKLIPGAVIDQMRETYQPPSEDEGFQNVGVFAST